MSDPRLYSCLSREFYVMISTWVLYHTGVNNRFHIHLDIVAGLNMCLRKQLRLPL